jgi:hypothetical protein
MAVIIDTLGIAKNTNIDATEMSVGVGISPILRIYNLKAYYMNVENALDNKVEHNGEYFYIQMCGIGVNDPDSLEAVHTMDYEATRILVCRDNKTKKTLFSFPINHFYVNEEKHRDENGKATSYQLRCKTCSKTKADRNTGYIYGDFDITVYEIDDVNKNHTVISTEKSVAVESYGEYNTVYNSSISNIVNLQDYKAVDSEWSSINRIIAGLDSNYIMYPCWIYGMDDFFPKKCINDQVYKNKSSYSLTEEDIETEALPVEFDYDVYENFFKLLIPKDKKVIKRAGLYTINLSGEYF